MLIRALMKSHARLVGLKPLPNDAYDGLLPRVNRYGRLEEDRCGVVHVCPECGRGLRWRTVRGAPGV